MTKEERKEAIEFLLKHMKEVKLEYPNGGNDWLYADGNPDNILKDALDFKRMFEEEEGEE